MKRTPPGLLPYILLNSLTSSLLSCGVVKTAGRTCFSCRPRQHSEERGLLDRLNSPDSNSLESERRFNLGGRWSLDDARNGISPTRSFQGLGSCFERWEKFRLELRGRGILLDVSPERPQAEVSSDGISVISKFDIMSWMELISHQREK